MNEDILTPEEELMELSDAILSIVYKKENVEQRVNLLMQFQPEMFRDENFILYKLLKTIWVKPQSVPDRRFIELYFSNNDLIILKNREYLDIASLDDDTLLEYKKRVLAKYDKLTRMQVDKEDLDLYIEKYKLCFKTHMTDKALSLAKQMVYSDVQIGRKKYRGAEDATSYIEATLSEINQLLEGEDKGYAVLTSELGLQNNSTSKVVSDFGELEEFNELFGKVRTPFMYSIQGGTKGGKTTLTRRIAKNGLTKYKSNVLYWSTEDTLQQTLSSLRAMHYADYYKEHEDSLVSGSPTLSQKQILYGEYPSDAIMSAEHISFMDLCDNPNYGNLVFVTAPLTLDNIDRRLKQLCEQNKIDMVVIDYLQEVHYYGSNTKKNEAISIAYQKVLQVTKELEVAVIAPAQFSQKAMHDLAESADGKGNIDTRLLGGESSEITRTPDANIVMYSTVEDLANNYIRFLPVPSRIAKQAPDFGAYVSFETGEFISLSKIN